MASSSSCATFFKALCVRLQREYCKVAALGLLRFYSQRLRSCNFFNGELLFMRNFLQGAVRATATGILQSRCTRIAEVLFSTTAVVQFLQWRAPLHAQLSSRRCACDCNGNTAKSLHSDC